MRLPWPTNKTREDFEAATIEAIGRPVDFVYVSGLVPCTTCSLDPINNTSTDSFCPECSGYYWIKQFGTETISAHVTWRYSENLQWPTGGKQFEGDCQVKVPYSGTILTITDSVKTVLVDDREMVVDKVKLLGAPTTTRILFILQEQDKND